MALLAITRFTNETNYENNKWKLENDWNGCIYGSPKNIVCEPGQQLIVIEMNNDENKIIGIGLIKNQPDYTQKYNIYKYGYYNRKIFKGNIHIDISQDADNPYNDAIRALEKILFYGKTHYKRGLGIQLLKSDMILKHVNYNFTELFREIIHSRMLVSPSSPESHISVA